MTLDISSKSRVEGDITSQLLVFCYLVLVVCNLSINKKQSLYPPQASWHIGLKYSSFVYLILSPAAVAFVLLQGSPWLNDANPNTEERVFYITGAQHSGIMCCTAQCDEKKFTQVETTGLATPLWITYSDKWPLTQGHLHFTATLWECCICVCQG